MSILKSYFNWLQKDVPAGDVEKYPEIDNNGETSVKGVFVAGDLTGIPLLKLAAENGKRVVTYLVSAGLKNKAHKVDYQLVIIGGGPAGISAGMEAEKEGLNYVILESAVKFNTIVNFPKGKPIYAEPSEYEQESSLKINDGTKESLLEELKEQIKSETLNIKEGVRVEKIFRENDTLNVVTNSGNYTCVNVIVAIGKSGDARRLNIPGEEMPKVFNRLFDPRDTLGKKIMVVGGGDSALETAIATAEFADSVTIVHRKDNFSRGKEGNKNKLNELESSGKINVLKSSTPLQITESGVIVSTRGEEVEIENDLVFTMIGRELPFSFFRNSGIKMEGELSLIGKLQFLLLILISGVIYFGKSSADFYKSVTESKLDSFTDVIVHLFSPHIWYKLLLLPWDLLETLFSDKVRIWSVTKYINAVVAYISFIGAMLLGLFLLYNFLRKNVSNIRLNWKSFKYLYFILTGIFFVIVFFGGRYTGYNLLDKSQSFWYTALYSLTILVFGARRMYVKPTRYIRYQTTALILVQVLPLFLLPEFILPWLGKIGALGTSDGYVLTQIFPKESYWRSYGFILAWPLNFSNLYNGNITTFWLVFSIIQTFVIIPLIVYKWGKGAYCGWICSCGAMAETLGDEYRTKAPHGAKAKKWENIGQWVLVIAFIITAFKLIGILYDIPLPIINEKVGYTADVFHKFYYISIDVIFAGVLGVGVYFFMSGRIWCRFGCPLAALMHIYAKFTKYRIFAEKKKCISCNICTKVCHMGIDVMNYANKGIPMNDVECVRCSACVVNCPTEVLYFGAQSRIDPDNIIYKTEYIPTKDKSKWGTGLDV